MFASRFRFSAIAALALTLASSPQLRGESVSPYTWQGVSRVVAIGDVHGSYDKVLQLLRGTRLIDEASAWTGGDSHLVLVGDLIDRGPDDRPVLDLVRRLQPEAAAAGGMVHVLLGNHEVMNMSGDLRYVSEKGFRDFQTEDDRKARNLALQRFRSTYAPGAPLTEIRPAFEQRFPPGYFGRLQAFWYDGEYGSWLLQQPAVIKINNAIFLHGGLTGDVAALGLDGINRMVHESILDFMKKGEELVQLTGAPPSYGDAMRAARELGAAGGRSDRARVARTVLQLSESLPYVPSGPLWYRGVSNESERLERGSIDSALARLGADIMVVGHTPTASGRINSRFAGRVFRIDVGMAYGRQPLALVFDRQQIKIFDPASGSYGAYVVEPPAGEGVAHFSEQLPEDQLLEFLRTASITGCEEEQDGVRFAKICDLERQELHLRAVFQSVDEKPGSVAEEPRSVPRTYRNEIAAYRLDRMLGIGMLPATVERAVDGVPGSLQIWLDAAVDLPLLETYDKMELLTGLEDQIIRAEAFMAVMDVHAAHPTIGVMLLPRERRLQIADVTKAFSTSTALNPQLMTPPCHNIDAERELYLRSITAPQLAEELGGYLSAAQIEALLARRDRFLDMCTSRTADSAGS